MAISYIPDTKRPAWTYQPDVDQRTPGILISGSANVVPTTAGGFRPANTAPLAASQIDQPTYPAVGARVVGSRYLLRNDGTDRLFAGTATKIYEANQVAAYAWTDESRAGDYSGVTQWMFDQYGATSLAAASLGTRTEIQFSTGTVGTSFANLTNAPKAKIIVAQDNALYAFNYDPAGTAFPDGWIRTDTGNITNWTPGSGECVSGTFLEAPGDITAAIKHGTGVVVWKSRGMWRGQYVGLPEVVRWELISPEIGCVGPLAAVNIHDCIYFLDASGFWVYDGSRPRLLSEGIWGDLRNQFLPSPANITGTQFGVDDVSKVISIHLIGAGSVGVGYFNYHYETGAWGPFCQHTINGTSTAQQVSSVCNGPFEKITQTPGIDGAITNANAYWFIVGSSGTYDLRAHIGTKLVSGSAPSDLLFHAYTIVPSLFGSDDRGQSITRLYHDFSSYTLVLGGSGALETTTDTLQVNRRPFGRGTTQATKTGTYNDTLGYTDIIANGNWFKETLSFVARGSAASDVVALNFEWLGFHPEKAPASAPRN